MNSLQESDSNQWEAVYITHSLPDAHIVAGRLIHEGIQAIVHTQPGASAFGIQIGTMGEIQVLVDIADSDLAKEILEPSDPEVLPDTTDEILIHFDDEDD